MVYKYAPGSRIKADPNIAGQMCEQLENSEGGLTAKTFLDANRPEDAPLHGEFEWDDSKAAEAYRLDQSRYILRSLVIVPDEEKPKETVRAVFTIADGLYESTRTLFAVPEKRTALLDVALRELTAFQRKFATLTELAPIWAAIENLNL